MSSVTDRVERLLAGQWLWPWQWHGVLAEAEPAVVDALVDRVGAERDYRLRNRLLEHLLSLARDGRFAPRLADPRLAAALATALAAERLADAPSDTDSAPRPSWLWYQDLLTLVGGAADAPLRALLAGPPCEVGRVSWSERGVTVGAKLQALAVLAERWTLDDTDLLAGLTRAVAEPREVRDAAAPAWYRLAGAAVAEDVVALALSGPVGDEAGTWLASDGRAARLAALGGCLVEPLVRQLAHPSVEVRLRAKHMLQAVGEPAVDALTEVVRTTPDWHVRQNAEEALGTISRRALTAALAQRAADDRSLSPAEPPSVSAERGLSRAE